MPDLCGTAPPCVAHERPRSIAVSLRPPRRVRVRGALAVDVSVKPPSMAHQANLSARRVSAVCCTATRYLVPETQRHLSHRCRLPHATGVAARAADATGVARPVGQPNNVRGAGGQQSL